VKCGGESTGKQARPFGTSLGTRTLPDLKLAGTNLTTTHCDPTTAAVPIVEHRPDSDPISVTMSAPSLGPYIAKRTWLSKWVKPIANWYVKASGYRQLGLRYDSLPKAFVWRKRRGINIWGFRLRIGVLTGLAL
jgi:hypothetical protein